MNSVGDVGSLSLLLYSYDILWGEAQMSFMLAAVICLTDANRQALTRMYKNREACTISCFAVALLFGESFSIRIGIVNSFV